MTRGDAIRTFLLNDITVGTLVGSTRIHPPPIKPTELFPAATYHEVVGAELESLEGRTGNYHCRLQIGCWDKVYSGAEALRDAIKDKMMNGFQGAVAGTLVMSAVNHAGDRYFYDGPNLLHHFICEFWIWWENA